MRVFRPSLRLAISVPFALILATTVALQAVTQQDNNTRLIDKSSVRILDALTVAATEPALRITALGKLILTK